MTRRYTFPVQPTIGHHPMWNGPAYLQGTWEDTGTPCPILTLSGTVAFWEEHIWICAGGSDWAYVDPDGKIQGFVHYKMPREHFTEAKRIDVVHLTPVPMVTLPPQPVGSFNGKPLVPGPATVEYTEDEIAEALGYAPRPTATSSPATASRWNGTCPRCGRGTYTGAWDVEHEGGSCS